MRLFIGTVLFALSAPLLSAQTLLGAGPATISASAPSENGPFVFDGPGLMGGFHGSSGWLHGLVGTDTSEPGVRRRIAGGDLALGLGAFTLLRTVHGKPGAGPVPSARVSLPVRLSGGYRYLNVEDELGDRSTQSADGRLGMGGALDVRYPLPKESVIDEVALGASVVGSLGATANLTGEADTRGVRDLAVLVDLRLARFGSGGIGLGVGYEYRRTWASRDPLDTGGDFVDVLTDASTLFERETYNAFRIGFTW